MLLKEKFDKEFDEWTFLEVYMTDYYHSDYIAWIDDIDCVLDGEKTLEDVGMESSTTINELEEERNRLMRIVLKDAFNNYIEQHYGKES